MSTETEEKKAELGKVKCNDCGAFLSYNVGTTTLKCEYCASEVAIPIEKANIDERDFDTFLADSINSKETHQTHTVQCKECGATTTLSPKATSDNCPYCSSPLVVANSTSQNSIKPQSILPFKIEKSKAIEIFSDWLQKLKFAPNDLKYYANNSNEKLTGIYLPFWTYDCTAKSEYFGKRGEHYTETETYTDSDGNSQTREVQKTSWSLVSGTVQNNFDDILVCASKALPINTIQQLEPWDLDQLVDYNEDFLSGFKSESYSIDLKSGWNLAQKTINSTIEVKIRNLIGGNEQIIDSLTVKYNDKTFKHILLPLWISAYKYKDKVYQFTINARTGEIQGERPYSFWKRFFVVLIIAAIILVAIYIPKIIQLFK